MCGQDGSAGYDHCKGAVVDNNDGSVILAGWSQGDWSEQGHQGGYSDFVAVKLDADGEEIWRYVLCECPCEDFFTSRSTCVLFVQY